MSVYDNLHTNLCSLIFVNGTVYWKRAANDTLNSLSGYLEGAGIQREYLRQVLHESEPGAKIYY